jgi:hypothetical protein
MVIKRRVIFTRFVWYVPPLAGLNIVQSLNSSQCQSKLRPDSSVSESDSQHRIISHLSHYDLRHYFWSHHIRYHFDCQFRYILFYFISLSVPSGNSTILLKCFAMKYLLDWILENIQSWGRAIAQTVSRWRPRFDPRSYVLFVVDKAALWQVFSEYANSHSTKCPIFINHHRRDMILILTTSLDNELTKITRFHIRA